MHSIYSNIFLTIAPACSSFLPHSIVSLEPVSLVLSFSLPSPSFFFSRTKHQAIIFSLSRTNIGASWTKSSHHHHDLPPPHLRHHHLDQQSHTTTPPRSASDFIVDDLTTFSVTISEPTASFSHQQQGRAWISRASKSRSSLWKVCDKRPVTNASDSDSDCKG